MATTVTSTIRASGGDYTTLSAWEAAKQGNLVTADQVQVAECYDDWASGLSDSVIIDGSTTDSTRYMKVTVAVGHRHTGLPQTGFYIANAAAGAGIIKASDDYSIVEWADVSNTGVFGHGISIDNAGCIVRHCIARSTATSSFLLVNGTAHNCLAYGGVFGYSVNATGVSLFNCVASGYSNTGFNVGTWSPVVKNCVAYNNTTNYSGTFDATSANNATSTGSDDAPGGSSVYGIASANFVNAAGNDFHLATGTNSLVGAGVNLYSTFTTDIDGDTWPSSGAWDIGFDYRTGGGPVIGGASGRAGLIGSAAGQKISTAQTTGTVRTSAATAATKIATGSATGLLQSGAATAASKIATGSAIGLLQPGAATVASKIIPASTVGLIALRSTVVGTQIGAGAVIGGASGRVGLIGVAAGQKIAAAQSLGSVSARGVAVASKIAAGSAAGRIATSGVTDASKIATGSAVGQLRPGANAVASKIIPASTVGLIALRGAVFGIQLAVASPSAERTLLIPAESRLLAIPAESRLLAIAAENRTLII